MFKSFFISALLLLNFTLGFASLPDQNPMQQVPQRQDHLDANAPQLQRARMILRTIVPDPESYQIFLSDTPHFGAEAVPPGVFSDKPTVIMYAPSLSPKISNEEIAFMMAHELGHLNLHHMEKVGEKMDAVFDYGTPPMYSGITFCLFYQKLQEREADLYGYSLYKKAGYDMAFFPRMFDYIKTHPGYDPHMKRYMGPELPTMSMQNPHFSMYERFQLLSNKAQGLV